MEENSKSNFKLSRLVRTASSEIYLVWDGDSRIGQVHLHYANDVIHAAVLLEADLTTSEEEDLLEQIDADIVSSYMPSFEREDLLVTMFRAEEIGSFSYSLGDMDDFELDDDDEEED